MESYEELEAEAERHESLAKSLRQRAGELRHAALKARPLAERLIYSAHARCPCGSGLAYDPVFEDENSVFVGPLSGYWDCAAILLGVADPDVQHIGKMPFAFYEVESEGPPPDRGATTRPQKDEGSREEGS